MAFFVLAEFDEEPTFDAELSDALALSALFAVAASVLAVPLLEFFAVVLFVAIAALAAIDPFAAELLLLAPLLALFAAALWAAPLLFVAPCPC